MNDTVSQINEESSKPETSDVNSQNIENTSDDESAKKEDSAKIKARIQDFVFDLNVTEKFFKRTRNFKIYLNISKTVNYQNLIPEHVRFFC
jgi:hypothetical protein